MEHQLFPESPRPNRRQFLLTSGSTLAADENSDTQPSKFPKTDVLSHVEVADGRIWLLQEGIDSFAGDLCEQEKKLVWATQTVPTPDLFAAKAGGTAWKSKPSWYIVARNDRTIQPDCERFLAKRMNATTTEVASSHVVMLSQPQAVIDVIRKAVKGTPGKGCSSLKQAKPPPLFDEGRRSVGGLINRDTNQGR